MIFGNHSERDQADIISIKSNDTLITSCLVAQAEVRSAVARKVIISRLLYKQRRLKRWKSLSKSKLADRYMNVMVLMQKTALLSCTIVQYC